MFIKAEQDGAPYDLVTLDYDMPGISGPETAEKIRQYIEVHQFPGIDSATCSFGVSCLKNNDDTKESIVKRADEALYLAKRGGRNQVVGDTSSSKPQSTQ